MERMTRIFDVLPPPVKVGVDVGVWGVVLVGWLEYFRPWATALATLLAIIWTSLQIYDWYLRHKK